MLPGSLVSTVGGAATTGGSIGGPIGAAIGVAAAAAKETLPLLFSFITGRRGEQKESATACADQAERDMARNRDLYLADPNRTAQDKAMALQIFDALANELLECCGQPSLGSPGQNCINERIAKDNNGNWIDGNRYQWVTWYLYPIMQDQPQGTTGIAPIDNITNEVAKALNVTPWIAFIALAVLLFVLYRRAQG